MISYWKNNNNRVVQIDKFQMMSWVNVIDPTNGDMEFLKNRFDAPEDFLQDILDDDERARTEVDGKWLLIIVRIPTEVKDKNFPLTIPLGILISVSTIITVCTHENPIINDLIFNRIRNLNIENRHSFVLQVLFRSASYYLKYLKEINKKASQIENDLRSSVENSKLYTLLSIQKCLVYFMTSLKSNEILISKLQKSRFSQHKNIDEDLLEDVIIENRQAIEMANIHTNIISGTLDAFASIISNNLNVVMKRLTSITIILMIPTLISSFYGMNVPNHLETSQSSMLFILLGSILIAILGIFAFRKLKWF